MLCWGDLVAFSSKIPPPNKGWISDSKVKLSPHRKAVFLDVAEEIERGRGLGRRAHVVVGHFLAACPDRSYVN